MMDATKTDTALTKATMSTTHLPISATAEDMHTRAGAMGAVADGNEALEIAATASIPTAHEATQNKSSLQLQLALNQHQSDAEALESESSRLQHELDELRSELDRKMARIEEDKDRNNKALAEKRKWIKLNEWYLWLSGADETCSAAKKPRVEDVSMLPVGYAHSLGSALLELGQHNNNTNGARMPFSISLILRLLLPASCVPFDHIDFETQASDHLAPLLQHVATSSTLRRIVVSDNPDPMRWSDSEKLQAVNEYLVATFLDAMSSNPCIDTLALSCPVPASVFGRYAAATNATLKILEINLGRLRDKDQKSMTEAFQAMRSLEILTLEGINDRLLYQYVTPSLESISVGCFALQELKFRVNRLDNAAKLWIPLAKVCHGTRHSLRHVEFHGFSFCGDDMAGLVTCLKCPDDHGAAQNLPSTTVSKLSLPHCRLNDDAWQVLTEFMQTTPRHSSALRELHGIRLETGHEEQRSVTSLLGIFDCTKNGDEVNDQDRRNDSIGLHLQALSVQDFNERCAEDLLRIFSTRLAAAGYIQLQSLSIIGPNSRECHILCDCLVSTVLPSLRQLHLSKVYNSSSENVVHMMRRNGNICQITVTGTGDNDQALFSPSQQRRVDAYCQRNVFLLELADEKQQHDPNAAEGDGNRMDPAQYAMLLRVARQVSKERMKGVVWRLD